MFAYVQHNATLQIAYVRITFKFTIDIVMHMNDIFMFT